MEIEIKVIGHRHKTRRQPKAVDHRMPVPGNNGYSLVDVSLNPRCDFWMQLGSTVGTQWTAALISDKICVTQENVFAHLVPLVPTHTILIPTHNSLSTNTYSLYSTNTYIRYFHITCLI